MEHHGAAAPVAADQAAPVVEAPEAPVAAPPVLLNAPAEPVAAVPEAAPEVVPDAPPEGAHGGVPLARPQGVEALVVAMGQLTMQLARQQTEQQLVQQRQLADLHAAILTQQQLHQQMQVQYQALLQNNEAPLDARRHPRTAACDRIATYAGLPSDKLDEWLDTVERVAEVEGWGELDKRRVAVSKVSGVAAQWHDRVGHDHLSWATWVEQLRAAFEPKLTMAEWGQLVERRKQIAGESGIQYALDKVRLCRRCPIELPEKDLIPYLIRGLGRPEHAAVFMAAPPPTVSEFMTTMRRLEALGQLPPADTQVVPTVTDGSPKPAGPTAALTVNELTTAFKAFGSQLAEQLGKAFLPTQRSPSTFRPPDTAANGRRPPAPRGEIRCYECGLFGNYARECPKRQESKQAENVPAGPSRQGQL